MSRQRNQRIKRLVDLKLQQRRQRESEHAAAQQKVNDAQGQRKACVEQCEQLDRELNECLCEEISPDDLALIGGARTAAAAQLERAAGVVKRASDEAEASLAVLMGAHRAHRSMEILHERAEDASRIEETRAEQKELDDLSQRRHGASERRGS